MDSLESLSQDDAPETRKKYLSKATGKLYPAMATPGTILFVLRVIGCLRGIATQLGVSQSYLAALKPHAKAALEEEQRRQTEQIPRIVSTPMAERVLKKLQYLCDSGAACGIQLCLYDHGRCVVNCAAGLRGPTDLRPVDTDTLFSVFSCGKGLAATLCLALKEDGLLDYEKPLASQPSKRLRRFFKDGSSSRRQTMNDSYTPLTFLEHRSGFAGLWPPRFAKAFQSLDADYFARREDEKLDARPWRDALKHLRQKAIPDDNLGHFEYHAVSFGWTIGCMCELAANQNYEDLFKERLAIPLNIERHVYSRLPFSDKDPWDRLADVCLADSDLASLRDFSAGDAFGADPRLLNEPAIRATLLPSSTVHASAFGLATLYAALANKGRLEDDKRILRQDTLDTFYDDFKKSASQRQQQIPFGFRPYVLSSQGVKKTSFAFGHAGLGQMHAFADPQSGLAVACVLNKLSSAPKCAEDAINFILQEFQQEVHLFD